MKNIAIIIVTYNPNIEDLKDTISACVKQSKLIVVVDNSTSVEVSNKIKDELQQFPNIVFIPLGDNYGEAYAQNVGLKFAMKKGYNYFIELDQDTLLPPNYVENIYASYIELKKNINKIGGIGPIAIDKDSKVPYRKLDDSNRFFEVDKTLSSGFFIPKEVLEKVGLNDENLFIDYVDWDWCWRARSLGYKIFIDKKLRIYHKLGNGHKNFVFFKLGIPAPIRHYYQYRNALLLLRKKEVPLLWKIKRLIIHAIKPLFFLFFYDERVKRFKYIFKGIVDGILGKTGRID